MVLRKVVFFVALNFCRRLDWIEEEEEEDIVIVDLVLCSPVPWLKRSLSFFLSFLFCVSCPGLTYSIYLSPPLVVVVVVVVVVVCSLSSEALRMDDG